VAEHRYVVAPGPVDAGRARVDPVPGGSANFYDYVNTDPVNDSDRAGTRGGQGAYNCYARHRCGKGGLHAGRIAACVVHAIARRVNHASACFGVCAGVGINTRGVYVTTSGLGRRIGGGSEGFGFSVIAGLQSYPGNGAQKTTLGASLEGMGGAAVSMGIRPNGSLNYRDIGGYVGVGEQEFVGVSQAEYVYHF
jgi:hypothetical protein